MSRHNETECWIDREHFDSCALAAESLGINRSVLSRNRRRYGDHFTVLDELGKIHDVDFIKPPPLKDCEVAPPAPPPRAHHPGDILLRGRVRYRLGVYR